MSAKGPLTSLILGAVVMGACGGDGNPQGSPEDVVSALYERIAGGEFEDACDLIVSETRQAAIEAGGSCEGSLSHLYPEERRAEFENVKVDAARVERAGDTAIVPEEAVTFDGRQSDDADTPTVRRDGKWWVALNS